MPTYSSTVSKRTLHPARHGRFARRATARANRGTVVIVVLSLPATTCSGGASGGVRVASGLALAGREPFLATVLARSLGAVRLGSIGATQSGSSAGLAASADVGSVLVPALG